MRHFNFLSLLFAQLLLSGCVPSDDLSSQAPYKSFVGKVVVAKRNCRVFVDRDDHFVIRKQMLGLGSLAEIPFYETRLQKVADVPTGTRVYIESIKHAKVVAEKKPGNEIVALCTVSLPDGRKLKCQTSCGLLDPDPRKCDFLRFELEK